MDRFLLSINLLPPSEKDFLKKERRKKILLVLSFEFFLLFLSLFLVILAVKFSLLGELKSQKVLLKEMEERINSSVFDKTKNEILKYNQVLLLIDFFQKNKIFMSKAIEIILKIEKPSSLYFTNFSSKSEKGKILINIAGFCNLREDLITFKENLEKEKRIRNLQFSPESWINPSNVNFKLSFELINVK